MKEINNMHLKNVVIQLRKVCSNPILLEGPRMHQHAMDDELIDASEKFWFPSGSSTRSLRADTKSSFSRSS